LHSRKQDEDNENLGQLKSQVAHSSVSLHHYKNVSYGSRINSLVEILKYFRKLMTLFALRAAGDSSQIT